jgi:sec-independent protein translocase protein TatA|tara:strand:+ start:314 stop:523 length:210 start_codon:yes stop_codon:yes gene_type:complete
MSFGITELMIILVIVLLLFGTKKLRSIGSDLGGAIKGFRSAVTEDPASAKAESSEEKETTTESPPVEQK